MLPFLYGLDDTGLAAGVGAGLGVGVVAGFDAGTAPTDLSRIPSAIALQMAFTPTLLYRSASSLSSTNPTFVQYILSIFFQRDKLLFSLLPTHSFLNIPHIQIYHFANTL